MVAELDVVVVEPASGDDGDVVEACDRSLGKEAGEDVTDDSADAVRSKDLHLRKGR